MSRCACIQRLRMVGLPIGTWPTISPRRGGLGLVLSEATPSSRADGSAKTTWGCGRRPGRALARVTRLVQAEGQPWVYSWPTPGARRSARRRHGRRRPSPPAHCPLTRAVQASQAGRERDCSDRRRLAVCRERALPRCRPDRDPRRSWLPRHQFLSPPGQPRTDAYGARLPRMRFLWRYRAVRQVWPPDKPLIVRLSATD